MNLPNRLTSLRIALVPVFVALMSVNYLYSHALALVVFIVASITDYMDGRIARQQQIETNFGKLLDPLADKILVAAAFVMMMDVSLLAIPGWTVVIILSREFLVTGARALVVSEGNVLAANRWGKLKTVLQMTYVISFLFLAIATDILLQHRPALGESLRGALPAISLWAIVIVALLTLFSGIQFFVQNRHGLNLGSER